MGIAPLIVGQADPIPVCHGLRLAGADVLCRNASLLAGNASGEGGGLRDGFGQPHQFCRQLCADLWTLRIARAGSRRLGNFDHALALLHGCACCWLPGVVRPRRALASAALCRRILLGAHGADCAAGRTGGGTDRAGGWSVFGEHAGRRTPGRGRRSPRTRSR